MAVRDGESFILQDVRARIKEVQPEGSVVTTAPISGLDQEGPPGGIDLTRDRLKVEIQGHGNGIQFNFDPAMIQQLQNATGLTPVIIDMHPMLTTVPVFFGVKQDPSSTSLAPVF